MSGGRGPGEAMKKTAVHEENGARTDETLVAAAQGGDRQAEEELIGRYKETVRRRALPYYILGADREDVVQEGMIGLFKAVHGYDATKQASFATYAGVCIERQILDAIKAAARKKHEPLNTSLSMQEEDTERRIAKADYSVAMEELSPWGDFDLMGKVRGEWRESFSEMELAVLERRLAGEDTKTIAEEIGRDPKSVYNAVERMKKKIRRLAEETGVI